MKKEKPKKEKPKLKFYSTRLKLTPFIIKAISDYYNGNVFDTLDYRK